MTDDEIETLRVNIAALCEHAPGNLITPGIIRQGIPSLASASTTGLYKALKGLKQLRVVLAYYHVDHRPPGLAPPQPRQPTETRAQRDSRLLASLDALQGPRGVPSYLVAKHAGMGAQRAKRGLYELAEAGAVRAAWSYRHNLPRDASPARSYPRKASMHFWARGQQVPQDVQEKPAFMTPEFWIEGLDCPTWDEWREAMQGARLEHPVHGEAEVDTRRAQRIVAHLTKCKGAVSPAHVARACELPPPVAGGLLYDLTRLGILERSARGGAAYAVRPGALDTVTAPDWVLPPADAMP